MLHENWYKCYLNHSKIKIYFYRNGSEFECLSTVVPNNSLNHKSFDCLKKLKKRQKEVENLEKENIRKKLNEKTVALKCLTLEDVYTFGGDFSKIFTWIPGKKVVFLNCDLFFSFPNLEILVIRIPQPQN